MADIRLKETDRYLTPKPIVEVARRCLGEVEVDLFGCAGSHLEGVAKQILSYETTGDSYLLNWGKYETIFANPPYSGANPRHTFKKLLEEAGDTPSFIVAPASMGADYWKRHVWPRDPLVGHAGRLCFEKALVDGTIEPAKNGARHDIALLLFNGTDEGKREFQIGMKELNYPVLRKA